MKILHTTKLPKTGYEQLMENHTVQFPTEPKYTTDELIREIADADILISTFDYKIDSVVIAAAPKLKMIANFGVGFNNVDLEAASARGIVVTNTPDPVIEPTAEHTFALLHAISHRVAELDHKLRMPNSPIRFGVMNNLGFGLSGKTLGIVGMGNIGKAVARRAIACGMKIIYHNRRQMPTDVEQQYNARFCTMEELLSTADVVSLHMPYTPETHHLIDEKALATMKQGSILINTSRGACVHEAALIHALQSGHLFGAALDVYEFEPQISPELFELDNVVMSPHIGTGTIDGRIEMSRCVARNILHFLNNEPEKMNRVN